MANTASQLTSTKTPILNQQRILLMTINTIRQEGGFPRNYSNIVAAELNVKAHKVRAVANGRYMDKAIAECLLRLATNNVFKKLIDQAKEILKKLE